MFPTSRVDSGPLEKLSVRSGNVTAAGFESDGRWMFEGGEGGVIRIWDRRERGFQMTLDAGKIHRN